MIKRILAVMLLGTGALMARDPVAEMYEHQVTLVENDVLSLAEALPQLNPRQAIRMLAKRITDGISELDITHTASWSYPVFNRWAAPSLARNVLRYNQFCAQGRPK